MKGIEANISMSLKENVHECRRMLTRLFPLVDHLSVFSNCLRGGNSSVDTYVLIKLNEFIPHKWKEMCLEERTQIIMKDVKAMVGG